jgi:hypothetical protein
MILIFLGSFRATAGGVSLDSDFGDDHVLPAAPDGQIDRQHGLSGLALAFRG